MRGLSNRTVMPWQPPLCPIALWWYNCHGIFFSVASFSTYIIKLQICRLHLLLHHCLSENGWCYSSCFAVWSDLTALSLSQKQRKESIKQFFSPACLPALFFHPFRPKKLALKMSLPVNPADTDQTTRSHLTLINNSSLLNAKAVSTSQLNKTHRGELETPVFHVFC